MVRRGTCRLAVTGAVTRVAWEALFPLFGSPGRISQQWGGSAGEQVVRAGESFHELLTKNHDFLAEPAGAFAIIDGRNQKSLRSARQSPPRRRAPHPPCGSS